MFDDILPKRKDFYEEMKEMAKQVKKEDVESYTPFDELMDLVKELTEEIEQAELAV